MNNNKLTVKDGFKFGIGLILAVIIFYVIVAIIGALIGVSVML